MPATSQEGGPSRCRGREGVKEDGFSFLHAWVVWFRRKIFSVNRAPFCTARMRVVSGLSLSSRRRHTSVLCTPHCLTPIHVRQQLTPCVLTLFDKTPASSSSNLSASRRASSSSLTSFDLCRGLVLRLSRSIRRWISLSTRCMRRKRGMFET